MYFFRSHLLAIQVVGRRKEYLEATQREETSKKFLQLGAVEVDWEAITAKINLDLETESKRPNAKPV